MTLKQKLAGQKTVLGSWITLAHPGIAEMMAKAGFDWLAIDMEHTCITVREAEELIRIVDLCGVSPLVRLTNNDPNHIKRMMDAGAHGVIVPMVNSKADAEKAVSAVHYPPKGKRGVGLARAQGYGARFQEYKSWAETEPVVIVQIEHVDAIENLEAILPVEGIAGFMVGPYDLSASMGLSGQFDHPNVKAALQKIRDIASKSKVPSGFHVVEPDMKLLKERRSEGFKFLAFSTDMRVLESTFRSSVKEFLGK